MTYREVKYSNLGLEDIDRKMLMGINVTPIMGLLYTPVLIRYAHACPCSACVYSMIMTTTFATIAL